MERGRTRLRRTRRAHHAGDLPLDCANIGILERRRRAALDAFGKHDENVRTQPGDILLDIGGQTPAKRDHGDHGGDADDDPQRRQETAQQVPPDLAKREQQRRAEHPQPHVTPSRPALAPASLRSTKPSRKWTMVRA